MIEEERKLMIDYLEAMKEECVEGEGYERHPLPEWYVLDKVIKIIEQQPSENEQIIKVSKGAVKAMRTDLMKLQTYKMFPYEATVYVERDDVLRIFDKYTVGEEKNDNNKV